MGRPLPLFFKYCCNFCILGRMNWKGKGKRGKENMKKEINKEERRKDRDFLKSFHLPKKVKPIISEGKALKVKENSKKHKQVRPIKKEFPKRRSTHTTFLL